jgi:predicted dehydrogenase
MVTRAHTTGDGNAQPLRLIQVGVGGFGTSWASDIVPSVPGVELVAAVDPDPEALTRIQTKTPLRAADCFSSLDEALDARDVDAVLVTASLAAHVPSALTALEAGKHVLMEKPFAPSLTEAQRAIAAATQGGLILQISQNYRFMPAVRCVTSLITGGEYGEIDTVYVDFRRFDNTEPPGDHRHYHFPQPMVVDMAIHHFDLMRLVTGREPVEVYCRSWNPTWSKFDEPAETMAIVRMEGDVMVSYRGSWLSGGPATPWAGEWRMELSGGEITWTSRDGKPADIADEVLVRPLGGEQESVSLPHVEFLDRAGSLDAFVRAVRTGEEPETSGRRNLKTLGLTLAAVESSETGRPVLIKEPRLEAE